MSSKIKTLKIERRNKKMKVLNFYNEEHKKFYEESISKRVVDPYHESLIYLLALTEDTRQHFAEIYNLEKGEINIDTLDKAWQTSTSLKIIRLAFNLFNGFTGTEEAEASKYAVDNIFCTKEFAPYFWQAVKIRFEL